MANKSAQLSQRQWRKSIITRLKAKLGHWCRGCEKPEDAYAMPLVPALSSSPLFLVIPNRRSEDLERFGNNTITIYSNILQGKLPLDKVTLLCEECKFRLKGGE